MDEDDGEPIGHHLDGLGVRAVLEDGDLVAGAVVLLKVVEGDGSVRLTGAWSDGMSWLERRGMLAAATDAERVDEDD